MFVSALIIDCFEDVYSLSQDAPKALTSWKKGKELPYRLLSDPQQNLIRPLGGKFFSAPPCTCLVTESLILLFC